MKIYISDLDGTLLQSDQELSPFSVETVSNLHHKGVAFSVATARSLNSAGRYIRELGITLPVILHNGVFVYDPVKDTYLSEKVLSSSSIEAILDQFRGASAVPMIFTTGGDGPRVFYSSIGSRGQEIYIQDRTSRGDDRFRQTDQPDLEGRKIITVVAIGSNGDLAPVYEKLKNSPDYHVLFTHDLYSDDWWLEITHSEANKGSALNFLRDYLDASEVSCFGDNVNDLPMFAAADFSYAPENALDEVKDRASKVIESNDNDGVARFMREIVDKAQ